MTYKFNCKCKNTRCHIFSISNQLNFFSFLIDNILDAYKNEKINNWKVIQGRISPSPVNSTSWISQIRTHSPPSQSPPWSVYQPLSWNPHNHQKFSKQYEWLDDFTGTPRFSVFKLCFVILICLRSLSSGISQKNSHFLFILFLLNRCTVVDCHLEVQNTSGCQRENSEY